MYDDEIRRRALDAVDEISKSKETKEDVQQNEEFSDNEQPEVVNTEKEVLENNENTTETTEEKVETEQTFEITDDLVLKHLSEKLGKSFETFDDLVTKEVVKEEVIKEREYFSEDAKGFDAYAKETNRPLEDYLMLKRDIDSLSKDQVIKESLKLEYPDLSKEHLDRLYKKRFNVDPDLMDEDDIEDRELEIEIAYNKGKNTLKSQQEKYLVPREDSVASREAQEKQRQAETDQANQLWREEVGKTNSELTGLEVDLGDGFKFTHTITDEKKSTVKEIASDPSLQLFLDRYKNEDGSYNSKSFQRDIYVLQNLPSILSDVREHEKASLIENIDKEDRNISFKSDVKPEVSANISKKAQAAEDLWRARRKR